MREVRYIIILTVATAFYFVFSYRLAPDANNAIFFLAILWALPISIKLGSEMLAKETTLIGEKIERAKTAEEEGRAKLNEIKQEKAYLERKLTDLSKLYIISKEASCSVRFHDLFRSLNNFLKDNFYFSKFTIILYEYKDAKKSIDKIYEIKEGSVGLVQTDKIIENIGGSVAKSKKPLFLDRNEDLFNFGFANETKNILAIPLIAHKNVISAILIENIMRDEYDKFLIMAPQLAVQIERISLFDNIEKLSIMDGLTGTYLRRYFLSRVKEEIQRSRQSKMSLSYIMADLDHFKKCNDIFGHLVGDVVLSEIGTILKKNVREIDLVARYGGEEFCILLPETNKEGAYTVAERIRKAVEANTIKAYDESIQITLSMGIGSYPEDSDNLEELIEKSDKALYEAKLQGRNRICLA